MWWQVLSIRKSVISRTFDDSFFSRPKMGTQYLVDVASAGVSFLIAPLARYSSIVALILHLLGNVSVDDCLPVELLGVVP